MCLVFCLPSVAVASVFYLSFEKDIPLTQVLEKRENWNHLHLGRSEEERRILQNEANERLNGFYQEPNLKWKPLPMLIAPGEVEESPDWLTGNDFLGVEQNVHYQRYAAFKRIKMQLIANRGLKAEDVSSVEVVGSRLDILLDGVVVLSQALSRPEDLFEVLKKESARGDVKISPSIRAAMGRSLAARLPKLTHETQLSLDLVLLLADGEVSDISLGKWSKAETGKFKRYFFLSAYRYLDADYLFVLCQSALVSP